MGSERTVRRGTKVVAGLLGLQTIFIKMLLLGTRAKGTKRKKGRRRFRALDEGEIMRKTCRTRNYYYNDNSKKKRTSEKNSE